MARVEKAVQIASILAPPPASEAEAAQREAFIAGILGPGPDVPARAKTLAAMTAGMAPDDIRLKGTRVGIESVLYEYVHRQQTPETIAQHFPTLTLEQVHAAILYYLRNRPQMDAYLADWLEWGHRVREEQRRNPPPFVARLAALKEEREKYRTTES